MYFGLCIFCSFKMHKVGWIVWFGWFCLNYLQEKGMRREETMASVFCWLVIGRASSECLPEARHGSRSVLSVSTPYSQQAWGNFPARGNSTVKLPKFVLHGGVIQVTVCFQHAKLTLLPILHVEWEVAGELVPFFSFPPQPSAVEIHCFMRFKWHRRRIIFTNSFKGCVFKWLFFCDVHH